MTVSIPQDQTINEIKISINKYSIYLQKLVKDLKKRNSPLDKKIYSKPELHWFRYRSWYTPSIGSEKIIELMDWSRFVYAVYHDLRKTKYAIEMDKKIKKLTNNKEESLFENWLLEILFIFFSEKKDKFFTRSNLVNYLIEAIRKENPTIKTKSLLTGIVLEKNEIIIDKNLKIRKAKKADLEFLLKVGDDSYNFDRVIEESFCVLEYTYKKDDKHIHSWEKLTKIEIIFQLFKLCYAKCTNTLEKSSEITFANHGTTQQGFYPKRGVGYFAKIKNNEKIYFLKFYKIMQKRLTRKMVNNYFERDEIEIALSRYSKGLEWIHHARSSVSYAVMAIEALLIRSEGDQKLRFALKSSKLLSLVGLDMKKVYETMMLAYDVRSKYVHGDKISNKTSNLIKNKFKNKYKNDEKFAFTVMDYARLIIVIYIVLNKPKNELYTQLENTQFGDGKKLQKDLKPIFKYLKMEKYKPKFRYNAMHRLEYLTE